MEKNKCVYVLIRDTVGNIEMATEDDFEAWAMYRDMKWLKMQVWISGNLVGSFESIQSMTF